MAIICMSRKTLTRRTGDGPQPIQRLPHSLWPLLAALGLLAGSASGAARGLPDEAIDLSAQAASPPPTAWALQRDYRGANLLDIRAPALSGAERAAIGGNRRGPTLVGMGQAVPDAYQGELGALLEWSAAPGGGLVAAFQISAPDAKALRIGLAGSLPEGAAVRFFNPTDAGQRFEPYGRTDFLSTQAQGRAKAKVGADEPSVDDAERLIWSPSVAGSVLGVEVTLPNAAALAELSLRAARISNIQSTVSQPAASSGNSSACQAVDVACATTPSCSRTATVRIRFTESDGNSYNCTATTINDHRDTQARLANSYLLTAHHCIASQSEAATLEAWWHDQSAGCGSAERSARYAAYRGGADLIVSHSASDHSLLRLRRRVPDTAVCWKTWSTEGNQTGESVESVHHPDGGRKEWAQGQLKRAITTTLTDAGNQQVDAYEVELAQGALIGGSSGAGLFASGSDHRLIGVLSGGPDDNCAANHFGRFDRFLPYAKPYLQPDASVGADDHGGSISGAAPMALGSVTTGGLTAGDRDIFKFEILESGTVTVQTEGSTDTRGTLLNADGAAIFSDDDRGQGGNFRIDKTVAPGTYYIEVKGFDGRVAGAYSLLVDFMPSALVAHIVPLFLADGDSRRESFLRIVNRSPNGGIVRIAARDDAGKAYGPIRMALESRQTIHLNSSDIERGNEAKPLSGGVGDGAGDWRLTLSTSLDIRPQAYVRTAAGFVTSLHDLVGSPGKAHNAIFFNPASNSRQRSLLRLMNPHDHGVNVLIDGRDDQGKASPKGLARLRVPPWAAVTLTAEQLESGDSGAGLTGSLGDGAGKWQLFITSDADIQVMSLLEGPTGQLSNLSTINGLIERD